MAGRAGKQVTASKKKEKKPASKYEFRNVMKDIVLNGVTPLSYERKLGQGAYGTVYEVTYNGTICAAKEIHSSLVENVDQEKTNGIVEMFMRECVQCSRLRHPNVIQFLGVYYPSMTGVQRRMQLPVLVMEIMKESLTSLVKKDTKIPVHIKYSIVHDVSLGLCYLHNHDPPIVHRDLTPNNILLTANNVAKISDLGVAKVIPSDNKKKLTKVPGTGDFMPPESFAKEPQYGTPMDIFSFAGIILHTFNQKWPSPSEQVQVNPITKERIVLSEVERRQEYLDQLTGDNEMLKLLVMKCLDDDPDLRPTIATIHGKIKAQKDCCMEKNTSYLENHVATKINQLESEVNRLKHQMVCGTI